MMLEMPTRKSINKREQSDSSGPSNGPDSLTGEGLCKYLRGQQHISKAEAKSNYFNMPRMEFLHDHRDV